MPQPKKYIDVISVIERRIRNGDYLLRPVPGERRIAEETGVSHMTARKAVRDLLDRKVLIRHPNGALDVSRSRQEDTAAAQVVMLYPAFPSAYLTHLCLAVTESAAKRGLSVRPVQYVHWDDPIVISAVSNPGGAIVIPASLDIPAPVMAMLTSNHVVSLDLDLSDSEIPSVRLFPDSHIEKVFDHLLKLGHTRIDCISSHVHNPEVERRIRLWRDWSSRHGVTGEIHERATSSFSDPTPYAYDVMKRLLADGPLAATAFIGTTFPAALGAMRACWEHGLVVGKDISICAMNIEAPSKFMTPSITGLDTPDFSKILHQCFDWFSSGDAWKGSRRLEPVRSRLHAGESSGPLIK